MSPTPIRTISTVAVLSGSFLLLVREVRGSRPSAAEIKSWLQIAPEFTERRAELRRPELSGFQWHRINRTVDGDNIWKTLEAEFLVTYPALPNSKFPEEQTIATSGSQS